MITPEDDKGNEITFYEKPMEEKMSKNQKLAKFVAELISNQMEWDTTPAMFQLQLAHNLLLEQMEEKLEKAMNKIIENDLVDDYDIIPFLYGNV